MSWNSPADFFAMGGYGLYVWGAYGVTAACMLADAMLAGRRHRRALRAACVDVDASPAATAARARTAA
jgi:heme exporter protein D